VPTLQARAAVFRGLQTQIQTVQDLLSVRAEFVLKAKTSIAKTLSSESFFLLDRTMTSTLGRFGDEGARIQDADPALFQKIWSDYTRLSPLLNEIVARDLGGAIASGTSITRATALANDLGGLMQRLATRTQQQADALVVQNRSSYASSRNLFIGVATGSFLLALFLGFVVASSLTDPLRRTEARLAEISGGDFSRHVEVANRDEVGALAANVNRMNDELRRVYEALETASQHKSDFLANMSHELRTPLNAIIGFSEVLREQMFGELNERQLGYVDDVLEAGRHLLSLINDVLDLAKVEAGRMELELSDVSIPDVLRSGITMHNERAKRSGVELALDIAPEEIKVRADERRVRQVVFNLLSNAVRFTPPQGRIDVSSRLDDGMVEIAIADSGPGIPPEELDLIFEEFEQGRDGVRRRDGTGLGLPLSRKFAELHGGRLWVESSVGLGSTFRFTLPVVAKGRT
jgi:signal transduction histidine kinase